MKLVKKSPYYQIDVVLGFLYSEYKTTQTITDTAYRYLNDIFEGVGEEITDINEVQLVLNYLISERYIEHFQAAQGALYRISFTGLLLVNDGGYEKKKKIEKEKQNKDSRTQGYLFYATIGATITGSVLFFWEVFKFGYEHHWWFACACHCK